MSVFLFVLLVGFVAGSSLAVWNVVLDFIIDLPIPLYFFFAFMSMALIASFWMAVFQVFVR